jgi:hypothetical protein
MGTNLSVGFTNTRTTTNHFLFPPEPADELGIQGHGDAVFAARWASHPIAMVCEPVVLFWRWPRINGTIVVPKAYARRSPMTANQKRRPTEIKSAPSRFVPGPNQGRRKCPTSLQKVQFTVLEEAHPDTVQTGFGASIPVQRTSTPKNVLRPTLCRVLRHNRRYRRKTEPDFPRSPQPCRRQSEPEFA